MSFAAAILQRSREKRQADIDYLSQRPLDELRRDQDLLTDKIEQVAQAGDADRLMALQEMERDLTLAILRSQFGEVE